ncbi:hypothetical protein CHMI_03499 [Cellulomonas hominis]|nr:hypothetical protein CHMI_03499 [Cellulomonas hominis]
MTTTTTRPAPEAPAPGRARRPRRRPRPAHLGAALDHRGRRRGRARGRPHPARADGAAGARHAGAAPGEPRRRHPVRVGLRAVRRVLARAAVRPPPAVRPDARRAVGDGVLPGHRAVHRDREPVPRQRGGVGALVAARRRRAARRLGDRCRGLRAPRPRPVRRRLGRGRARRARAVRGEPVAGEHRPGVPGRAVPHAQELHRVRAGVRRDHRLRPAALAAVERPHLPRPVLAVPRRHPGRPVPAGADRAGRRDRRRRPAPGPAPTPLQGRAGGDRRRRGGRRLPRPGPARVRRPVQLRVPAARLVPAVAAHLAGVPVVRRGPALVVHGPVRREVPAPERRVRDAVLRRRRRADRLPGDVPGDPGHPVAGRRPVRDPRVRPGADAPGAGAVRPVLGGGPGVHPVRDRRHLPRRPGARQPVGRGRRRAATRRRRVPLSVGHREHS